MTATLQTRRIVRLTDNAVHVYDPPAPGTQRTTAWGSDRPVGRCVAWAQRKDGGWEVRLVGEQQPWHYDSFEAAAAKLSELTGVGVPW